MTLTILSPFRVHVLEENRETPHSPKSNYVDRSVGWSVGPPGSALHDRYPISPSASENKNQLRGPGALRNRSNLRARGTARGDAAAINGERAGR